MCNIFLLLLNIKKEEKRTRTHRWNFAKNEKKVTPPDNFTVHIPWLRWAVGRRVRRQGSITHIGYHYGAMLYGNHDHYCKQLSSTHAHRRLFLLLLVRDKYISWNNNNNNKQHARHTCPVEIVSTHFSLDSLTARVQLLAIERCRDFLNRGNNFSLIT